MAVRGEDGLIGDRPIRPRGAAETAVVLAVLGVIVFARHAGDGFLSDDFLFLDVARGGVGALLRYFTGGSYPKLIRPIPGLAWLLGPLPLGAAMLHVGSILVHLLNASLVGAIVRRGSGSFGRGLAAAALFFVFPIFAEPVLWLGCQPDLFATLFSLLAVWMLLDPSHEIPRAAVISCLFGLALLSKESAISLPLVATALVPWRRCARVVLAMTMVLAAYAGARLVHFGGPGGYTDASGGSLAFSFDAVGFLRTIALQVPARILVPLKQPGALFVPLALASVLVFAGLAAGSVRFGSSWPFRVALAVGAALVPVAPILGVQADHQGSRLLYLPVALAFLILGTAPAGADRPLQASAVVLALFWAFASIRNGRAWTQASRLVEKTLAAMEQLQPAFPSGSDVLVDALDTWEGAYVLRNGLPQAARIRGLRSDVTWRRGSGATLPPDLLASLGTNVFVIGTDASGAPKDWTTCERALLADETIPSANLPAVPPGASGWISPEIELPGDWTGCAIRVVQVANGSNAVTVYFRLDRGDAFTTGLSRQISLGSSGRFSAARLSFPHESRHVQLRIEGEGVGGVSVVGLPEACRF